MAGGVYKARHPATKSEGKDQMGTPFSRDFVAVVRGLRVIESPERLISVLLCVKLYLMAGIYGLVLAS